MLSKIKKFCKKINIDVYDVSYIFITLILITITTFLLIKGLFPSKKEYKQNILINRNNSTKNNLVIQKKLISYIYNNLSDSRTTKSEVEKIVKICFQLPKPYNILMLSIIKVESSFYPKAINNLKYKYVLYKVKHNAILNKKDKIIYEKIAVGLCQIKPYYWWRDKDISQLFDIETNILLSYKILHKFYIDNKYDIKKVLKKYCGQSGYVEKVLYWFARFQFLLQQFQQN